MNVGQLRKAIAELPDDMVVITDDNEGPWFEAGIYVAPAHRDRRYSWSISEDHVDTSHEVYRYYENTHVLLVSGFGQDDDCVDLTPDDDRSSVIDGEVSAAAALGVGEGQP